ncbi:glycosyltransferase family 2 protein [Prevotella sp. MA2016]|uniref:glycosyltransferase family 2 protein n=1 Tax=Prevotella sp. MA2016 TaxID=1408310 RepID=UPI00056D49B1|nr:glycosyltransferase family 2 protein [Prevotella sp. MA2016]
MVSIIIPTYCNLALLQQALEGIKSQQGVEYEVIVVDDSPNDEISNYVSNNHDLRYFHNKPSLGAVKNWNYGISLARGQYIILHHHDEYLKDEGYLQNVINALNSNDVVITNIKVDRGEGYNYLSVPNWLKCIFIRIPSLLLINNLIGPCACVAFKKEISQFFDTNLVWKVDSEWYYRIFRKNKRIYLKEVCVYSTHGHNGQITGTIDVYKSSIKDIEYLRGKYSSCYMKVILYISKLIEKYKNRK